MRCVICRQQFDFAAGEVAVVLRHVAYGYDFAHPGACEAAALGAIFPEPGYDSAAFAHDPIRRAIVAVAPANGWSVVGAGSADARSSDDLRFEPLRLWALVEYRDGTRRFEGVVRAEDWLDEPGGAEFPESRAGWAAVVGYAPPVDFPTPHDASAAPELIGVAA
jgi:hypothetical protein